MKFEIFNSHTVGTLNFESLIIQNENFRNFSRDYDLSINHIMIMDLIVICRILLNRDNEKIRANFIMPFLRNEYFRRLFYGEY